MSSDKCEYELIHCFHPLDTHHILTESLSVTIAGIMEFL